VNLAVLYRRQEQVREREYTFRGQRFSPDQVRFYEALKEKIVNNEAHIFHPGELRAPRQSGKTFVLLKLASDFDLPLISHNKQFARMLSREYSGVNVIGPTDTSRLRGSRYRSALVDEGVDINRIDPSIQIITGINGRNFYNGY
jgi:hypothetical protein